MNNSYWVGVDLGHSCFCAALVCEEKRGQKWRRWPTREFPHTPAGIRRFAAWVKRHTGGAQPAGICAESVGAMAWRWVSQLGDALGAVALINPRFVADFARAQGLRDKTDRIDACVLALYGLSVCPPVRPMPTAVQQDVQRLTHLYEATQQDLLAWRNRLGDDIPAAIRRQARAMQRRMQALLTALDEAIAARIAGEPAMREAAMRMQSVPGVGPKTARVLLAEYGDLAQYSRTEIVALAGLYPRRFQSGTSVWKKPRVPKTGKRRVRKALYMAALVAKRWCPPIAAFAKRLRLKGLTPKAVTTACMAKLLRILRALVVTKHVFNYP